MKTALLLVLCAVLDCSAQRSCDQIANLLVSDSIPVEINLYEDFLKCGKAAIPQLIAMIDIQKKMFVGFQEPTSSTLYPIHLNRAGIKAAYMIEYILSKGTPRTKGRDTLQYRAPHNIFTYGVIVKKVKGVPQMKPLEAADMRRIKALYLTWWEHSASKAMNRLTREWRSGKSALTATQYAWY